MAAPIYTPYVDGWFGADAERELTVVPEAKFPFANNPIPDTYSRAYERRFSVAEAIYLPRTAARTTWTNLLTWSEVLGNPNWTKVAASITSDATTAPDGEDTMEAVIETTANSEHSIAQGATVTAAATELSFYAKGGLGRDYVRAAFTDSAATAFTAFFDIAAGVVGTLAAGVTGRIVSLGNGHFQCILRFTPAAGAGTVKINISTNGSTISYTGDAAKGVYLWGIQIATGSAVPYISTTVLGRQITAPQRDPIDAMAYLVREDEPQNVSSAVAIVTREHSRMPNQQVVPTTVAVQKPALSGSFPQVFGDFRVFQPDSTVEAFDAYAAQTVTSDTGAPGLYPTGGTYTLTFDGDTTGALNYNDSAGTIQTALNALTAISDRGNVVVGGSYNSAGGITITFNSYAACTIDTSSLTSSGSFSTSIPTLNAGYTQSPTIWTAGFVPITGGTFTITIFGQTTGNIAYNATAADVETALELLSEVTDRGGCTVTIPPTQTTILGTGAGEINFTIAFSNAVFTAASGSLTPLNSLATPSITDSVGRTQKVVFSASSATRDLYCANHGIEVGDTIYIYSGTYYSEITDFTVPNVNTIQLNILPSYDYAAAGTITEVGKRTKEGYEPGSATVRGENTTTFYLPGVTAGITVAGDIPVATNQSDPGSFLPAVFAGTGTLNYFVGELDQYIGPILQRTVTTINAADV